MFSGRQDNRVPDRILASTAPEWRDTARDMLSDELPDAQFANVGEDLVAITAEGLSIADVAAIVQEQRHPFVRHLFREVGRLEVPSRQGLEETVDDILTIWDEAPAPMTAAAALQVWTSGSVNVAFRPDTLRRELEAALGEESVRTARAGMGQVLSVCIAGNTVLVGLNAASNALSDWPGGRVRLAKPKVQVSRSEFKLEELFRTTPITLPGSGRALDLGASPGGWTRILRQHGMVVVAVDPADLDARLRGDRGIHQVRTTAGAYLEDSAERFDVIVNDMRMDPELSVQLMLDADRLLAPGGMMIVTLKLSPRGAIPRIEDALSRLETVVDLALVRQLHHNRNEITVVGEKRS